MKKRFIHIALLAFVPMFFACSEKEAATETLAPETVTETKPITTNQVQFTAEQQKVSGIELGTIKQKNLSARIQANGQIQLPPQNKASINPLLGGVVRSISVKEGEYVQKGKVLATIMNPELIELQEEYLTTQNQLKLAEQDLERQQTLRNENIGAGKKFEQAQTEVQVNRARKQALATHLQALGISPKRVEAGQITSSIAITAPISGFVQEIAVNMGTYAQPGQEMFEIVDNSHLHLILNVFEKDYTKLEEGQRVQFVIPNVATAPFEAKIFSLGKAFEGDSRMVTVHAEMENDKSKKLLPGMYVNAQILAGQQELPTLPEQAIVRYKNQDYAFMQEEPTVFKMMQVKTGVSENGLVEVIPVQELPVNAKLVTHGAYYLLAEKMKSEVAED